MTENKTNNQTNNEQSLVKPEIYNVEDKTAGDEYMSDFKAQAQNYGQQFQDAAAKAKDYANDKFTVASDKFKELQNKDPKELVEEAKEYARQKPGQALAVSAVIGLVLGWIFRGGRK
jgi:ElaB/YqjD/DUF883 family membrane-anchored ribosome-binding protein